MGLRSFAAIVVAAVLVSGCGEEEGAGQLLRSAAAQLERQESYESRFELRTDLGGRRTQVYGSGPSDSRFRRARLAMRYTDEGQAPLAFEMILNGPYAYLRGAPFASSLPPGTRWLRATDQELLATSPSPAEVVELLLAEDDARHVGTELIRGEETAHVRVPVAPGGPGMRIWNDDFSKRWPEIAERTEGVVDLWIRSRDQLLARYSMEVRVDGVPGSLVASADILRYGVGLKSTRPPRNFATMP
jgi:hypothetical protein